MKTKNSVQASLLLSLFLFSSCGSKNSNQASSRDNKMQGADAALSAVVTPGSPPLSATYSSIRDQIFAVHCTSCHQAGGQARNVILDNYRKLMDSPRDLVLPGDSASSGLLIAIIRTDKKRMPPEDSEVSPLSEDEIATVKKWIDDGALEKDISSSERKVTYSLHNNLMKIPVRHATLSVNGDTNTRYPEGPWQLLE